MKTRKSRICYEHFISATFLRNMQHELNYEYLSTGQKKIELVTEEKRDTD